MRSITDLSMDVADALRSGEEVNFDDFEYTP